MKERKPRRTRRAAKRLRPKRSAPVLEIKPDMVYTVEQVAAILQVTPKTARTIIANQEIPARKIGQAWRVYGEDLLSYFGKFRPSERG